MPKIRSQWTVLVTVIGLGVLVRGKPCGHPAIPGNGRVSLSRESLEPGTAATYSCDSGYELFGTETIICTEDGTWEKKGLPFCATNVALLKPVNQSTTVRGGAASNANDGDLSVNHDGNKCTETEEENSPWWMVNLLMPYNVKAVRVVTRGCCGHKPIQDLEIRVGNDTKAEKNRLCDWQPGTLDEGVVKDFICARPLIGRFVFVQLVGIDGSLSLCEVQVFTTEELSSERCALHVEPNHITPFNRRCYEFHIGGGATFDAAEQYCRDQGGHLLHSFNELEERFVLGKLRRLKNDLDTQLIFIGVRKEKGVAEPWKWVTGEEVHSPRWGKDQPNNYNGEQNCVVLDGGRDFTWNDVGCQLDYLHWICQFPPQACGSPDKKLNSTISDKNFEIGSEITYKCPEDSRMIGSKTRRCRRKGFWSGDAPSCEYVNCGHPEELENGVLRLEKNRTTYNATAEYSCHENYTLMGIEKRRCGDDGQWIGESPSCLFDWCPEPEGVARGEVNVQGNKAGSTAIYSCEPGHKLIGQSVVSCQLGGEWSSPPPLCKFIDCRMPPPLEYGNFRLLNDSSLYLSLVEYTCLEDYRLVGPRHRTCQENGLWSENAPICELIDCGEPEIPLGGYATVVDFTIHSTAEYGCDPGHYFEGTKERRCQHDGTWSGSAPKCVFVNCGRVPNIVYGHIRYLSNTTYLRSKVEYSCASRYRLVGPRIRVCQENATWTARQPYCKEIRCSAPPTGDRLVLKFSGNDRYHKPYFRATDAELKRQSFRIGSTVTYNCERGYSVVGRALSSCGTSGEWTGKAPTCEFVDCGEPTLVDNGDYQLLSNETYYGASALYECDENYRLVGRSRVTCQSNGTWSSDTTRCEEILCPEPEKQRDDTEVTVTTYSVGGVATYKCAKGQELTGPVRRECQDDGSWSDAVPVCTWIACPPPPLVENGFVNFTDTKYSSVVEYRCFPKYRRVGPFLRKCMERGVWSGTDPECVLEGEEGFVLLGDNTVDGTTNVPAGTYQGYERSSNVGVWIGVGSGLALLAIILLGILAVKFRMKSPIKNTENAGMRNQMERDPAVMSYSSLNDPYRQQNIYENVAGEEGYQDMSGRQLPPPPPPTNSGVTINGVTVQ